MTPGRRNYYKPCLLLVGNIAASCRAGVDASKEVLVTLAPAAPFRISHCAQATFDLHLDFSCLQAAGPIVHGAPKVRW
jgi:hypothetical protein